MVRTARAPTSNSSSSSPTNLLERVFDGDEADGGTEFVDDDGDVAAALLEFLEQIEDELGFRDDEDLAHDLAEAMSLKGTSAKRVVAEARKCMRRLMSLE